MTTSEGVLVSIEYKKSGKAKYDKKVAFVKMKNKESLFVEFRNQAMMAKLDNFSIGDRIEVAYRQEAAVSKNSGIPYNNNIAQSINPIKKIQDEC